MTATQTRPGVTLIATADPAVFLAQSRTDAGKRYIVTVDPSGLGATCECAAAQSGQDCRHAAALMEKIVEGNRQMLAVVKTEGAPVPAPRAPLPLSTRQLVSQRSQALYQQALEEFQILELCVKRAEVLQRSGLVPKQYTTVEDIALVLAQGLVYGFTTAQCFEYLYPVNGKVRMEARGMLDLINRQPGCFVTGEATNERARAVGHRPGRPDMEVVFTLADAQKANLIKDGPWKSFPADMLWWKAVARVARRQFPDIIGGMDIVASLGEAVETEVVDIAADPAGGTYRILPPAEAAQRDAAVASLLDNAGVAPAPAQGGWWADFVAVGKEHNWTQEEVAAALGLQNGGRQQVEAWAKAQDLANPVAAIKRRIDAARRQSREEPAEHATNQAGLPLGPCALGYEEHPATRMVGETPLCEEHHLSPLAAALDDPAEE